MNVTPEAVLPLVEPCRHDIWEALLIGIDYANDLQSDPDDRDWSYWTHSVRFEAGQELKKRSSGDDQWETVIVANSGLHIRLSGGPYVRVLKSYRGMTPPPGNSRTRRKAWHQPRLFHISTAELDEGVPLNLIVDWTTGPDGELLVHLGLPRTVWEPGEDPELYWRIELPFLEDLEDLTFEGAADTDVPIRLRLDEAGRDGE